MLELFESPVAQTLALIGSQVEAAAKKGAKINVRTRYVILWRW